MRIRFVKGDLFLNRYQADVIAHGCNCQGLMGAGIAVQFKKKYPEMYKFYRRYCLNGIFVPGTVMPWFVPDPAPNVFNLATQATIREGAELEYLRACFQNVRKIYKEWPFYKIALPAIGAGLGGLEWEDVKQLMIEELDPGPFLTIVYEQYVPESLHDD